MSKTHLQSDVLICTARDHDYHRGLGADSSGGCRRVWQLPRPFGPNFMYAAAMLAICGFQLVVFGLLASLHSGQADPVYRKSWANGMARWFSVERGLAAGAALLIAYSMLGVPNIWAWCVDRNIPSPARLIASGTTLVLGIETIASAFLVGVMSTHHMGDKL